MILLLSRLDIAHSSGEVLPWSPLVHIAAFQGHGLMVGRFRLATPMDRGDDRGLIWR